VAGWLGLKVFLDLHKARGMVPEMVTARTTVPLARTYRMGLATNLANPKSALFVASLFAATISTLYHVCLISLITHPAATTGYLRVKRKIDIGLTIVFIGFGTQLFLSQR